MSELEQRLARLERLVWFQLLPPKYHHVGWVLTAIWRELNGVECPACGGSGAIVKDAAQTACRLCYDDERNYGTGRISRDAAKRRDAEQVRRETLERVVQHLRFQASCHEHPTVRYLRDTLLEIADGFESEYAEQIGGE